MAVAAADVVARMRVLWPQLTSSAAPDATALAWVDTVARLVGSVPYGTTELEAKAHMLAHFMYRVDPAGLLGAGGLHGSVTGVTQGPMSVSFADPAAGDPGSDADLKRTAPGRTLLMLRSTLKATMPRWVS